MSSSLVLEQLVVLAELAQFRAQAAVLAAQRGKLTPQLRLQLSVGLKICLQTLHILLQPFHKRKRRRREGCDNISEKPLE